MQVIEKRPLPYPKIIFSLYPPPRFLTRLMYGLNLNLHQLFQLNSTLSFQNCFLSFNRTSQKSWTSTQKPVWRSLRKIERNDSGRIRTISLCPAKIVETVFRKIKIKLKIKFEKYLQIKILQCFFNDAVKSTKLTWKLDYFILYYADPNYVIQGWI